MAEPLHRRPELRGVHRERRVGRARVSGHRAGVVGRAAAVQRGPGRRRALSRAHIRHQRDRAAGAPAVQRHPSAGGAEHVRHDRLHPVRLGPDCHGAAAAPVRVPRVHIRSGHHHVRVHQKLQTVSGVRLAERRVGAVHRGRRSPVRATMRQPVVRDGQTVRVGVLLRCVVGPSRSAVLRHPLGP